MNDYAMARSTEMRRPDSRDAAAAAAHLHPYLPLVGYEQGTTLAHAQAAGFDKAGPLTVYVSDAAFGVTA